MRSEHLCAKALRLTFEIKDGVVGGLQLLGLAGAVIVGCENLSLLFLDLGVEALLGFLDASAVDFCANGDLRQDAV